jgi:hypothetical protein
MDTEDFISNPIIENPVEAVNALRKAIVQIDSTFTAFTEKNPSVSETAGILLELNLAKRDLAMVYDSLSASFSRLMEIENSTEVELDGGATIEKKSSYDRKGWQHKELASAVVDRIIQYSVDMDTGENLKSSREVALELLNYCAPSYWRVKELSSIGINADTYCETGDLKTSIIVRKGNNQ